MIGRPMSIAGAPGNGRPRLRPHRRIQHMGGQHRLDGNLIAGETLVDCLNLMPFHLQAKPP